MRTTQFFQGMAGHELHTLVLKSCETSSSVVDESGVNAIKSLKSLSIFRMDPGSITGFKHCTNLRTLKLTGSRHSFDSSWDDDYFVEGLPAVLEACPLEVLWVPDFCMLTQCRCESVKYLSVCRLDPVCCWYQCDSHENVEDFLLRFPSLQECSVCEIFFRERVIERAMKNLATVVQRVHQSASFLADLARHLFDVAGGVLDLQDLQITGSRYVLGSRASVKE